MTTGAEFPNFTNKRLMSFQDFATRTVGYLQELNREVTEIQFSEGAFSAKLPMDSPGVGQVRLNVKPTVGDYKVHDGNGHILDLQNDNVALFENTAAILYEVGAGRIDQPVEIAINPRTGKPDYDHYVEAVGDEAEPNSVTDNGSNITFRVDSLNADGGESMAGRTVRVFKKVPAATTQAVAIEELTVAFGGGQNTVTTSGLLGQATVSTAASDYLVQLLGLSVRRTTNPAPLSSSSSHFFAGTVLGNGGTPVTFDTTNQFIIQADAASAINFAPFTGPGPISWGIASTDMQNAIEEIVNELSTAGAGSGADLVAVDESGFAQQGPSSSVSWGGLGASGIDDVADALSQADLMLARARFAITHSSSLASMLADFEGADGVATYTDETHLLKGTGEILGTWGVSGMNPSWLPVVIGESPNKTKLFTPDVSGSFDMNGIYQNLQLGNKDSSARVRLGSNGGMFHGTNVVLGENAFTLESGVNPPGPSGVFGRLQSQSLISFIAGRAVAGNVTPSDGSDGAFASSNSGAGPKAFLNGVFEAGTDGPSLFQSGVPGSSTQKTPTIYANCYVYQDRSGDQALLNQSSYITFINCVFVKTSTDDDFHCVEISGSNNQFIGCYFYSANGNVLLNTGVRNTFRDCVFEANTLADSTGPSTPRFVHSSGAESVFGNCNFDITRSSIRSTGANEHICYFFESRLDGCHFNWLPSIVNQHNHTNIHFDRCFSIESCEFDFDNALLANAMTGNVSGRPAMVEVTGFPPSGEIRTYMSGCQMTGNIGIPESQSLADFSVLHLDEHVICCDLDMSALFTTNSTAGSIGLEGYLFMGTQVEVRGLHTQMSGGAHQTKTAFGYVHMLGSQISLFGLKLNTGGGFHANSGGDTLVRVENCSGAVVEDSDIIPSSAGLDCNFVFINAGARIRIMKNHMAMDGDASSGFKFVENQSADIIQAIGNMFVWQNGATDPPNTAWIDLSTGGSGDHSLVTGNELLNDQATAPAVQNAGTGSVTGADNLLAANVAT